MDLILPIEPKESERKRRIDRSFETSMKRLRHAPVIVELCIKSLRPKKWPHRGSFPPPETHVNHVFEFKYSSSIEDLYVHERLCDACIQVGITEDQIEKEPEVKGNPDKLDELEYIVDKFTESYALGMIGRDEIPLRAFKTFVNRLEAKELPRWNDAWSRRVAEKMKLPEDSLNLDAEGQPQNLETILGGLKIIGELDTKQNDGNYTISDENIEMMVRAGMDKLAETGLLRKVSLFV